MQRGPKATLTGEHGAGGQLPQERAEVTDADEVGDAERPRCEELARLGVGEGRLVRVRVRVRVRVNLVRVDLVRVDLVRVRVRVRVRVTSFSMRQPSGKSGWDASWAAAHPRSAPRTCGTGGRRGARAVLAEWVGGWRHAAGEG